MAADQLMIRFKSMCVSFYHTTDIKCLKTALPVGLSVAVAIALFWFNTLLIIHCLALPPTLMVTFIT